MAQFTLDNEVIPLDYVESPMYAPEDWSVEQILAFTEGEGSFMFLINKQDFNELGWLPKVEFSISLHKDDKPVLDMIQRVLGMGKVTPSSRRKDRINGKNSSDQYAYRVRKICDITQLIKKFKKIKFRTKKGLDFEKWCHMFHILKRGGHLTLDGLLEIANLRDTMNGGLSKKSFRYNSARKIKIDLKERGFLLGD